VCIGRLMVPRPITALVCRLARALRSNITLGDIVAADCFRPRWQRDYEFATDTLSGPEISTKLAQQEKIEDRATLR
jgi:hypothetical protein